MINWHEIDTVLLDMDGTLLDLHYDNFFWTQHLPRRYVDIHGGELESVSKTLIDKIMAQRGSLNWYCLDYWSEELRLDITALKREISHLICMHPSTQRFLESLQESGREVWLVTNAHQGGLDIKLEKTGLGQWVQRIITSHELALPKEDDAFWQRLADHWHYEPSRSLLIDDTATVLDSAARHGISHLITMRRPDSRAPRREAVSYPAIDHFDEILPIPPRD
ncbi:MULTISPECIES: GMP/IMP nucleotidase [Spongiibacter]|uniref:GMP/IMP nucleotidase n=1 Tax=Spongiibacter TaxID=630749 RepID=UPI000C65B4A2|nr:MULTISPECIES: GMP/IMP nucleotidase [Spongiibacter]MAY38713.1 haloacid dehalogenase [Spongiibacter sp.]MBI57173.1 haloacid dehalogenase [Spongiibacter sp.]MBO6752845.1 GMP/IMP nucleotidase [Spongiibacter sp.]|tara:strand:+ start:11175 stop:11840 length:666 start_codon:yes stop_codon:yes gene_type:complete